jgi:hypothetical protein
VRDRQDLGIPLLSLYPEHVGIEGSGPPTDRSNPLGDLLELLAAFKETFGTVGRIEFDHEVQKLPLLDTTHGFGLVEARHSDHVSGRAKGRDGTSKLSLTISEIRPESEKGPSHR